MKKLLLVVVAVLATGVVAVLVIGAMLPADHAASRAAVLEADPTRVFRVISDVSRYPAWRSNAARVEVVATEPLRWREHDGGDTITFEVVESRPPDRLRVRIADTDLPFGGTWTYSLTPQGEATRIEITENGVVFNPVFRFVSRFVIGHTATIDRFLDDLQAHVRQSAGSR